VDVFGLLESERGTDLTINHLAVLFFKMKQHNWGTLGDVLISVSLANLTFLNVWSLLLASPYYEATKPAPPLRFIGFILNVLLLAAVYWVSITLIRRSGKPWLLKIAKCIFVAILILPLNTLRMTFTSLSFRAIETAIGTPLITLISIVLSLAFLFVVIRYRDMILRASLVFLRGLSCFAILTFGQSIWYVFSYHQPLVVSADAVRDMKPPRQTASTPRVVWLLFDELDQEITFTHRPPSIKLPEMDRFKESAFVSGNAYPPSNATALSMPALIDGTFVSKTDPVSPGEIMLRLGDTNEVVKWSEQKNVFSDAVQAGANTAVVGWYHPYCRVLADDLNSCYVSGDDTAQWSLFQVLVAQWERTLYTVPLFQSLAYSTGLIDQLPRAAFFRQHQTQTYLEVMEQAKSVAADKDFGLVLIHLPVPHPPGIYDPKTQTLTTARHHSYLDNLELADRALGELRRSMEMAGTWDNTTVIITADHYWRVETWSGSGAWEPEEQSTLSKTKDHRIPFMIKMAGQKETYSYEQTFNTVLLRSLIGAIMHREIAEPAGIANWLDANKTIGESPHRQQ